MPTNNAVNVTSAGIVGFNGTAFVETTTTNHAVLIGGATTSTFSNVGPTSTAGQVLQSGGASADPAYSTATYPVTATGTGTILRADGTNWSATTSTYPNTNAVSTLLYASSANVMSALTTGNNGVLVTSASGVPSISSSIPTAAAASTFQPNAVVNIFEDFIGLAGAGAAATTFTAALAWHNTGSSTWGSAVTTSNAHPGIFASTSSTVNFFIMLSNSGTSGNFILGGGAISITWVFNIGALSTVTNRYTLRPGMGDTNGADQVNGVYFEYSDNINSGNWNLKAASASSRTTTSSSTAVTTGWHNATITINAAASTITYFMDGVSLGTVAATIPTAAITPMVDVVVSAGTIATNTLVLDLFSLQQILTTAR